MYRNWVALLGVLALLWAQLLLTGHVHAEEASHEGEHSAQACAICLFKASGQDDAGPLPPKAGLLMPIVAAVQEAAPRVDRVVALAPRSGLKARGPPLAAPSL